MDTVIYLDVNGKEVSRKTVEGKGRRPNEKDANGNFIIRIKEGFKLENGKVIPIPKKDRIVNPAPVVQEIKAPETEASPELMKALNFLLPEDKILKPEDPVVTVSNTPVVPIPFPTAEATITIPKNEAPISKETSIGETIAKDVKMVIYYNSQGQELLRKTKGGRGRAPKEIDKDGNFVVRIKDEFLDKFIKEHNLQNVAPSTVLSKKDSEVFVNKVLNENIEPDAALKEAAVKADEQKIETPAPNTESEPEEYEVSERRKKRLTIEPTYSVEEIIEAIMYSETENTNDPNGNITILNGVTMKNSIPELKDVLPFNAVFAKIEINVQENSIRAWSLPMDNTGKFGAPTRECYGCLKL